MSTADPAPGTRVICLSADMEGSHGYGTFLGSPPRPGWSHPANLGLYEKAIRRHDTEGPRIDPQRIRDFYAEQIAAGKMTAEQVTDRFTRAARATELEAARPVTDRVWQMAARAGCNPKIRLDTGETIWGCQCWWGAAADASPDKLAKIAAMPTAAAPPQPWEHAWFELAALLCHPHMAHLNLDEDGGAHAAAMLSPCGTYRYALTRVWDPTRRPVVFVMCNPSTADARHDDPTIRRCVGLARRWNAGGIAVVNLFALRSRDPRELGRHDDPQGPDNTKVVLSILAAAGESALVVAAWGTAVPRSLEHQMTIMGWLLRDAGTTPQCLGHAKDGRPRHPLMIRNDTLLQPLNTR